MGSLSFCMECNNLLYPLEEKESKTLNLGCRRCNYETISHDNLIYRNELKHSAHGHIKLNDDIVHDRTLPRVKKGCSSCDGEDAIYFQNRSTSKNADLRLTFVCVVCHHTYSEEDYQAYRMSQMDTKEDAYEDLGL